MTKPIAMIESDMLTDFVESSADVCQSFQSILNKIPEEIMLDMDQTLLQQLRYDMININKSLQRMYSNLIIQEPIA